MYPVSLTVSGHWTRGSGLSDVDGGGGELGVLRERFAVGAGEDGLDEVSLWMMMERAVITKSKLVTDRKDSTIFTHLAVAF